MTLVRLVKSCFFLAKAGFVDWEFSPFIAHYNSVFLPTSSGSEWNHIKWIFWDFWPTCTSCTSYPVITVEWQYTVCHKNHLLWEPRCYTGARCSLVSGQSWGICPPSGPPPVQTSSLPPRRAPWPAWGGSEGWRNAGGASLPSCRPPAGRCWAAAGEAAGGGSGRAPSRWSASTSGERSKARGGSDPAGQTAWAPPLLRRLRPGRAAPGGTGWRGGWRRCSSEVPMQAEGWWAPPAAAGSQRGSQECWPWSRWSAWVSSSEDDRLFSLSAPKGRGPRGRSVWNTGKNIERLTGRK